MPPILFGGPLSAAFDPLQRGKPWEIDHNGQGSCQEGSSYDSEKVNKGLRDRSGARR